MCQNTAYSSGILSCPCLDCDYWNIFIFALIDNFDSVRLIVTFLLVLNKYFLQVKVLIQLRFSLLISIYDMYCTVRLLSYSLLYISKLILSILFGKQRLLLVIIPPTQNSPTGQWSNGGWLHWILWQNNGTFLLSTTNKYGLKSITEKNWKLFYLWCYTFVGVVCTAYHLRN